MKRLLVQWLLVGLTAGGTCLAQDGTVDFRTRVITPDQWIHVTVMDPDNNPASGAAGWVAQLALVTRDDSLTPIGVAVPSYSGGLSSRKGTVSGGIVSVPGMAGAEVGLVMLAWDGFESDSFNPAPGVYGVSNIILVTLGGYGDPPAPPALLVGLEDFQIECLVMPELPDGWDMPEPSTSLLLPLGLVALGLRPHRRR